MVVFLEVCWHGSASYFFMALKGWKINNGNEAENLRYRTGLLNYKSLSKSNLVGLRAC